MSRSEDYPIQLVAWDNEDDVIGGYIEMDPDYLQELVDKWDDQDEDLPVSDRSGNIKLSFTLRRSEYEGTDWYGSAYIPKKKGVRRKKKRRR